MNIDSFDRLVGEFSRLPSVGKKTAQRYAYFLLTMTDADVQNFADAILQAKRNIHYCKVCANFTDKEVCDICSKPNKDPIICVVKEPKDVSQLEKVRDFNGSYHVLHGVINPLENKGPNDINLMSLLDRVNKENIREVIVATNPDVEGEATAMYLAKLIKPLGVKTTRLAYGLPVGSSLEYADETTLYRAMQGRGEL